MVPWQVPNGAIGMCEKGGSKPGSLFTAALLEGAEQRLEKGKMSSL